MIKVPNSKNTKPLPFGSFFRSPSSTTSSLPVPSQFTIVQWSLANSPSVGGDKLSLDILDLPSDNGSPITALQYQINGGSSWQTLSGVGIGERLITVPVGAVASVQVRAVNAVGEGAASTAKLAEPKTSSTASSVSQGSVTFPFAAAYEVGHYADGAAYVVAPSGLTMNSPTPAVTTEGSLTINGVMVNPIYSAGGTALAFDARGTSNMANIATFPRTLAVGDFVAKVVSFPGVNPADAGDVRKGLIQEWAVCHVVATAPPANAISPAPANWTGRTAKVARAVDLDAIMAARPLLSGSTYTLPDIAELTARVNRFSIGSVLSNGVDTDAGYQPLTVRILGENSNYGATIGDTYRDVALHWMANTADALVRPLVARIIQDGSWWYDIMSGSGLAVDGNGGHHQFHYIPMLFALVATGRSSLISTLNTVAPENQLSQSFKFTADHVARLVPHSSDTEPYPYRLRTISAISGNNITVNSRLGGDPYHVNFSGLVCKTAAGVTIGTVTQASSSLNATSYTVTLSSVAGLSVSSQVYFASAYPIAVGDYNWIISNANTSAFYSFNPSPSATYRSINTFAVEALLARALGVYQSSIEPVEGCVVSALDPDKKMPSPFASYRDDANIEAFWNAHSATLGVGGASVPTPSTTTLVASIIGQSENVVGFTHNDSYYTAGPYPSLLSGVDAQIANHKSTDSTNAPKIHIANSSEITAKTVNPGFIALANLWHLGSSGRPLRLVADVVAGTSMNDLMDDVSGDGREFSDSVALVSLAQTAWGNVKRVVYNWWNAEAAVAKNLYANRSAHFFGFTSAGANYDFTAGDLEHCLIDTTGRGYGLYPTTAALDLMLPGLRVNTASELYAPPNINYATDSAGATINGMITQNSSPAYAQRDNVVTQAPAANKGVATISPSLVRFGDYSGGVQLTAPAQTSIHPSMKHKDGQQLFSQDVAASLLIAEGHAQVSTLKRVNQISATTFDFVFNIPPGSTLTTQRLVELETVSSPRPHQQQVMGFVIARGADTDRTMRPLYRTDNADATLYPTAYRGTATITNTGTNVSDGREGTVRVVMSEALATGDRILLGNDGGYGGFILSGWPDYDAFLYRDGLRVYESRLDDGTANRYPGIPVRVQISHTAGTITAPSPEWSVSGGTNQITIATMPTVTAPTVFGGENEITVTG